MHLTKLFLLRVTFIPLFVLIGCASSGGKGIPQVLYNIGDNKPVNVAAVMADEVDGRNASLARLERGRIAQLLGDSKTSLIEFSAAIEKLREFDEQAAISLRDIGSHSGALLINDNVIPYRPAGFERVLVYHSQAINYLMEGNVESAGVEVRRANAEQVAALKEHELEIQKTYEQAKAKSLDVVALRGGVGGYLEGIKEAADSVKSSFQNAYTFYLSAVVHEQMGQANDAYIDYKKSLEIAPSNPTI